MFKKYNNQHESKNKFSKIISNENQSFQIVKLIHFTIFENE